MKRIILLLVGALLISATLFSQKRQIAPVFPGGTAQLRIELLKNLEKEFKDFGEHPENLRINFSVTKRGKSFNGSAPGITDPKVQKKIARAVRRLPRFKPGKANGVAIVSDISIEVELKD